MNGSWEFSRSMDSDPAYALVGAGGGPAGSAAAVCGARLGMTTLLREATGGLGGIGTSGLGASFGRSKLRLSSATKMERSSGDLKCRMTATRSAGSSCFS